MNLPRTEKELIGAINLIEALKDEEKSHYILSPKIDAYEAQLSRLYYELDWRMELEKKNNE